MQCKSVGDMIVVNKIFADSGKNFEKAEPQQQKLKEQNHRVTKKHDRQNTKSISRLEAVR